MGKVLSEFSYSPGYSDMRGARHGECLKKDGGAWVIETADRDHFGAPTVVTKYAVADEAAAEFEDFLIKNKVGNLAGRPDSGEFACDYSPWEFRIVFENGKREYFRFDEFKKYSRKDSELIDGVKKRFRDLRGDVISEQTREDD